MKKLLLLIMAITMLLLSFGTMMAAPQKAITVKNKVINHSCRHMTQVPVHRIPHDVTVLFLHQNQITSTDGIQKVPFSDLKLLDFSNNQLTDLKGLKDAKLNNLKVLTLSVNKLTSLAELPSNLANLKELFLYYNQLIEIDWPEDIDLSNLEILVLGYNRLTNLNGFRNISFPNLKELDLGGNPLTAAALLNAPWKNFPKLQCLWLPKGIDAREQKQIEQKIVDTVGHDVSIHWDSDTTVRGGRARSLNYPK